jgi:hypothetical protein
VRAYMGRNLPIKVMPPRGEEKTCFSAAQRDAVALVQHEEIQMSVKSVYGRSGRKGCRRAEDARRVRELLFSVL